MLIASALDEGTKSEAASVFSHHRWPGFSVGLTEGRDGIYQKPIPTTLAAALLLQAADAITTNIKFRRCKNCTIWFAYGSGTGSTSRKEFHSDACRMAWSRAKHKEEESKA